MDNINKNYTVFINCSPRDTDDKEIGLNQIINCIKSIKKELKFDDVMIYVIFDGVANRPPNFTEQHKINYNLKKTKIKEDPYIVNDKYIEIIEFDEWLHQANSLKKVMTEHCNTPIILSLQEDTLILNGDGINISLITDKLLNDENVEYIKLYIHHDITVLPGQERAGRSKPGDYRPECLPGTPHPSTNLLHKTREWSDRPHFATLEHYNKRVWPKIQPHFRCTMEQEVKFGSLRMGQEWNLWIYGERFKMCHECDIAYTGSGLGSAFNKKGTHRN